MVNLCGKQICKKSLDFACGKINSQVKSYFYLILAKNKQSFPQNCELFPQKCGKVWGKLKKNLSKDRFFFIFHNNHVLDTMNLVAKPMYDRLFQVSQKLP